MDRLSVSKLSKLQKEILAHVYHGHGLGGNRWGPSRYAWESLRDGDGVHTRAHSAAISRALRRLEKRGLLMLVMSQVAGVLMGNLSEIRWMNR